MEDTSYALDDFAIGELVLCKNVNRKEPWWPAVVLDPLKQAPGTVRRQMQPERLCVMFYGPPVNKKRPRDFCWAKEGDVLPLIEHLEQLQSQHTARKERGGLAFQAAVEEVLLVERGLKERLAGATDDDFEGGDGGADAPGCSSCGIPLNQHELEVADSCDNRCGNCQKLYEDKNFCPVCDKVWYPTEKNMVGCDSCTFWVHSHCDPAAAKVLKADCEEPYHCPACREKKSAKSRLIELRKAEEDVRKHQPRRPRSAYNLFAAEIHQQYNTDKGMRIEFKDMAKVVGETWRSLTPKERAPYEAIARQESICYEQEKRIHEEKHRHYTALYHKAAAAGLLGPDHVPAPNPNAATSIVVKDEAKPHAESSAKEKAASVPKPASAEEARKIIVLCNGFRGLFLLGLQRVICLCSDCKKKPEPDREFSCTQFEQHCGAGAAKKWKASLRIEPGSVPEVPPDGPAMMVGKWLEQQGIDVKPSARPGAAPALVPVLAHKATEKLLAAVYAPWNDMDNGKHKPVKVRWAGDRCTVCDSDVDYDQDQLVSCDMCGITVHQSCYGVQELPGEDDMWLCRACELKEEGKQPQCCLCPVEGGALKPTTEPGLWCHATCLQWIPEVSVGDDRRMEPVTHIRSIQKERWELNCCICKQRVGAKIQCNNCYTAYHPLCARMAGLYMNMVDASDGQDEGALRLISYCPKHCTPRPELAGLQLTKEEEELASEDDTNGLWNGQPFRPLPGVPLPDPPAGCARAQPLKGWERGSHGTGVGLTTNKGFWIPEKALEPPPQALLTLPDPGKPRALKSHGRAAPAPKALKRAANRQPKEVKQEFEELQEEEPPEAVELVPLAEGVPEVLPITCNGRSAALLVRSQRVQHGDAEMSASRFEQICGKGDAKKWKCSIWVEGQDGSPIMMMQDWLAKYRLDRKALAALAGNAQAVQAYQDHLQATVQDLVDDMLTILAPPVDADQAGALLLEDKPEQSVSKLDVAEAALIKHEHHLETTGPLQPASTAPDFIPIKQEQPSGNAQAPADTQEVRMTSAGAETDPLHNGHPAELPTPFHSDVNPVSEALVSDKHTSSSSTNDAAAPQAAQLQQWHMPNGVTEPQAVPAAGMQNGPVGQVQPAGVGALPQAVPAASVQNGPRGQVQEPGVGVPPHSLPGSLQSVKANPGALQHAGSGGLHAAEPMDVDAGAGPAGLQSRQEAAMELELMPQRKRSRSPSLDVGQSSEPVPDSKRQKPSDEGTGADVARDKPSSWVGRKCKVFWPDDAEWYDAAVRAYDDRIGRHNVWYFYDEEGEWLDLAGEMDAKRVVWYKPAPKAKPIQQRPVPQQPSFTSMALGPLREGSQPLGMQALTEPAASHPAASQEASAQTAASQAVASTTGAPQAAAGQPAVAQAPAPQAAPSQAGAALASASQGGPAATEPLAPQGKAAVGHHVAIWWPDDYAWYSGRIQSFQAGKGEHLIHYDDNEMEWLKLDKERVQWQDLPGQPMLPDAPSTAAAPLPTAVAPPVAESKPADPALEAARAAAVEAAAPVVPRGPVPDTVPIVCNNHQAVFDVKRTCILLGEGRECTPTEFERLAGKGASKKWKASLRVDKGGGVPGPTMGDWLVDAGLDTAKAVRPKPPPSMQAARRQHPARQQYGGPTAKPTGKQAHRDGCMCIICKQARRVGKTWGGMTGCPPWQAPMLTQGAQGGRGNPQPRFGKRAFLHALPQLVCGPLKHKAWKLPESRVWQAADWTASNSYRREDASSGHGPDSAPGAASVKLEDLSGPAGDRAEGPSRRGALSRQGSASSSGPAPETALVKAAAKPAEGGKALVERKGLTMKERLKICQQTERRRITFGKSGIHGWGLIAKADMKQDSMVVEYRGDLLRAKMSDDRQKYYNRVGKDCYLFNVNDDVVIDATMSGAIGRFTNHCCAPSMYTKVVEVEGESRLVFFARSDIKPGQELTYDYRFKEEEGDDKVQCKCGAPNCRGTLN